MYPIFLKTKETEFTAIWVKKKPNEGIFFYFCSHKERNHTSEQKGREK